MHKITSALFPFTGYDFSFLFYGIIYFFLLLFTFKHISSACIIILILVGAFEVIFDFIRVILGTIILLLVLLTVTAHLLKQHNVFASIVAYS